MEDFEGGGECEEEGVTHELTLVLGDGVVEAATNREGVSGELWVGFRSIVVLLGIKEFDPAAIAPPPPPPGEAEEELKSNGEGVPAPHTVVPVPPRVRVAWEETLSMGGEVLSAEKVA